MGTEPGRSAWEQPAHLARRGDRSLPEAGHRPGPGGAMAKAQASGIDTDNTVWTTPTNEAIVAMDKALLAP